MKYSSLLGGEPALVTTETLEESFKILQGKLLTIIDASYTDRDQRDAVKSLIKSATKDWLYDLDVKTHTAANEEVRRPNIAGTYTLGDVPNTTTTSLN